MRAVYPVSSKEVRNNFLELQEHLARLIGYDSNPYDNRTDVLGTYDTSEGQIDASGTAYLDSRVYGVGTKQLYGPIMGINTKYNIYRRYNG